MVKVIAHRGLSSLYPENTLISFKKAIELGVDFIELDVRETKDKKIVVIHDETVDRTTNGNGKISELTLEKIKKFDAGKWFNRKFNNEKISLLKEVFGILDERTKLFIEIKEVNIENFLGIVKEYNMEEKVIIGSFNIQYLIDTRKIAPSIPTAFITGKFPENISDLLKHGIQMINIEYHNLNSERINCFIENGLIITAWTVDKKENMQKMIDFGIPMITTNYPQILKRIIEK